jgi:hypothetical protein
MPAKPDPPVESDEEHDEDVEVRGSTFNYTDFLPAGLLTLQLHSSTNLGTADMQC